MFNAHLFKVFFKVSCLLVCWSATWTSFAPGEQIRRNFGCLEFGDLIGQIKHSELRGWMVRRRPRHGSKRGLNNALIMILVCKDLILPVIQMPSPGSSSSNYVDVMSDSSLLCRRAATHLREKAL